MIMTTMMIMTTIHLYDDNGDYYDDNDNDDYDDNNDHDVMMSLPIMIPMTTIVDNDDTTIVNDEEDTRTHQWVSTRRIFCLEFILSYVYFNTGKSSTGLLDWSQNPIGSRDPVDWEHGMKKKLFFILVYKRGDYYYYITIQHGPGRVIGSPLRTHSAGSSEASGLVLVSLEMLMVVMGAVVGVGVDGGLLASQI